MIVIGLLYPILMLIFRKVISLFFGEVYIVGVLF